MTTPTPAPNDISRRTARLKAIEKDLRLRPLESTRNGLNQLTMTELEHGFQLADTGEIQFTSDPVAVFMASALESSSELRDELWEYLGLFDPIAGQESLRRFYRDSGPTLKLYLERFPR